MSGIDIRGAVQEVLNTYAKDIVEKVKSEWTGWRIPSIEGNAVIDYLPEVTEAYIAVTIFGSGQAAWIMEYGRGSLLDRDNPYLSEYVEDGNFNQARLQQDFAILARPEGPFMDLDGNPRYSHGRQEGQNLENAAFSVNGKRHQLMPQEPLHIIRNTIIGEDGQSGLLPFILDDLANVILEYPFETLFPTTINL